MALLDSLTQLFKPREHSVIGIDIGSSAIKVVQLRRKKGRAVLETYGELAIGPYGGVEIGRVAQLSGEKLTEAFNDLLRESHVTTKSGGLAIPLASSLITFITVPNVQEKQLAEMISLEARKYIPVPINEVMLDWSIIPKDENLPEDTDDIVTQTQAVPVTVRNSEVQTPHATPANTAQSAPTTMPTTPFTAQSAPTFNTAATNTVASSAQNSAHGSKMTEVLVVAIHNESLTGYQTLMNRIGVTTSFFEIELFSAVRAVLERGVQPQMIVDMGAGSTKLYIIERGILRASHIINRGSQDITLAISKSMSVPVNEAENLKRVYGLQGGPEYKELTEIITLNLDYIFYEANRVLLNFQRKHNKAISKVFLTGGGVLMKGFVDLAAQSFQSEVVYANPFSKVETPAFLADQLKEAGPEFAIAIGAALRRLSETS